jgi:hypothetical protein
VPLGWRTVSHRGLPRISAWCLPIPWNCRATWVSRSAHRVPTATCPLPHHRRCRPQPVGMMGRDFNPPSSSNRCRCRKPLSQPVGMMGRDFNPLSSSSRLRRWESLRQPAGTTERESNPRSTHRRLLPSHRQEVLLGADLPRRPRPPRRASAADHRLVRRASAAPAHRFHRRRARPQALRAVRPCTRRPLAAAHQALMLPELPPAGSPLACRRQRR